MPDDQSSYQPTIPEAVRRQAARAEELVRLSQGGAPQGEGDQANNSDNRGDNPTGNQGDGANASTVGENQGGQGDSGSDPGAKGTQLEQTPQARVSPGAPETKPTQNPADTENWQQKYQTLQGKYSAEIPRLTAQVRELQQLVATVRAAPNPNSNPANSQGSQTRSAPNIPNEDIEAYGEDLVTATRRWARAEVDSEIQHLRGQVEQLSSRSQATEINLAQRTVEQQLDATVPNWQVVNNDPAFSTWLAEVDPFSGRVRHEMLGEAYSAGNGPRTSAFFKAFQNEQTAVNQPAGTATHTSNANPGHTGAGTGAGRVSLDRLAAPGRGAASTAGTGAPDKRMWSRDQITAFYQDKSLGKWDNREAEAIRMENDIFAAQSEGRIR